VLLPREGLGRWLRQDTKTLSGIRVTMIGSQLVPHPSGFDVLGSTDANLLVVTHCKFCAWQTLSSSFLGKRKCEALVFFKGTFRSTQEPLAERHVCLHFALLTREGVILDAKKGIEGEGWKGKFIRMSKFVLCRGEMQQEARSKWSRASCCAVECGGMSGVKRWGGTETWENSPRRRRPYTYAG